MRGTIWHGFDVLLEAEEWIWPAMNKWKIGSSLAHQRVLELWTGYDFSKPNLPTEDPDPNREIMDAGDPPKEAAVKRWTAARADMLAFCIKTAERKYKGVPRHLREEIKKYLSSYEENADAFVRPKPTSEQMAKLRVKLWPLYQEALLAEARNTQPPAAITEPVTSDVELA